MYRAIIRILTVAFALSLSSSALAYATQTEFERATACCWGLGYTSYCITANACNQGARCCSSDYFRGLISSSNEMSCSFFSGGAGFTASSGQAALREVTGSEAPVYAGSPFMIDGKLNIDALGSDGGNACGATPAVAGTQASGGAPVTTALEPAPTDNFNASEISIERLYLQENEDADPPVIGFLPFDDRFAVEGDTLYAVGWSEEKGYELVEVRDVGGPKVHNFNTQGSSIAGYPFYDQRSIKAFDGQLYFYARNAEGAIEFSSMKAGSARKDVDVDPSGSDIPLVYADGDGSLTYQDFHVEPFSVVRDTLMAAGSARVTFLLDDGSELVGPRIYDIEPQRVGRGKKAGATLADTYPDGQAFPRNWVEFNGAVYMIAKTDGGYSFCGEGRDYELVRLNDDGSSEVIEINPNHYAFYPTVEYPPMQVVGGDLYLVANIGPEGADHHELVRVTPGHDVSVVPINPGGSAFPSVDEIFDSVAWPFVPGRLVQRDGALYVFGAAVAGECMGFGCDEADLYEFEIVKVEAGGGVTIIDPTPGAGTTFPTWSDPWFPPGFFLPFFLPQEFEDDLYFFCGYCEEQALYRLDHNDQFERFSEWPIQPITDGGELVLGVERDGALYFTTFFFDDINFTVVEKLVKLDAQGQFTQLTSPDFSFEYVHDIVLAGDTLVAAANIFSGPVPDYGSNFLGGELLVIHPDDTLGYVDVAPGFREDGEVNGSFPWGLRVVGDSVTFASYTDPTWESPFYELFRVQIGGKGEARGPKMKTAKQADAGGADASPAHRAWPSVRADAVGVEPPAGFLPLAYLDEEIVTLPGQGMPGLGTPGRAAAALQRRVAPALKPEWRAQASMRLRPGAEAYKAHAERVARARDEAKAPVGSCAARVD